MNVEAELALKLNQQMDLLRWFYDHGINVHISPHETEPGWNVKVQVREPAPVPRSAFRVPTWEGGGE